MELIELDKLRDSLVGLPGVNGLSTEQRKRFTVAVELVANPSIIFMDEPTSGLDARSAAIVMRTVRNTVNTGRTVVCTIHQPSIDIFESFDEVIIFIVLLSLSDNVSHHPAISPSTFRAAALHEIGWESHLRWAPRAEFAQSHRILPSKLDFGLLGLIQFPSQQYKSWSIVCVGNSRSSKDQGGS